jgi:hypothetical protein
MPGAGQNFHPVTTINMSEQNSQLAVRPRASQQLATLLGMEPNAMLDTIKAQCFKGNPANISNEQLAAFVSIAAEMGVNPLLPGMLYAFPVQGGGIVPMMGPDGVYKKLSEHPDVDGWETTVFPEDVTQPPTHATTKIWRKNRDRPLQYTALLSEWKVPQNPNWNTRARHMLSLRSLKQCARQIIHGVPYDEDERVIMSEVNVTPAAEQPKVDRPAPPPRAKKGAATVAENPAPAAPASKGNVVEAEFTEVAPTPPPTAPTTDPSLHDEVTATLAKSAEQAAKAPAPEAPVARAFIQDGEVITVVAKVEKAEPLQMSLDKDSQPSAELTLSGGFVGVAHHHKSGRVLKVGEDGKPEIELDPMYKPGATFKFTLKGRKFKSGKTFAFVQSVQQEGSSASPAMELE